MLSRVAIVALTSGCGRIAFDEVPVDELPRDQLLAVGGNNSCAKTGARDVVCWGRGTHGGLGDGTQADRGVPGPVALDAAVVALNTNDAGTCALDDAGALWCWGRNERGQLGLGDAQPVLLPRRVDITDGAEVALGNKLACVRRSSGAVACAGARELLGSLADLTTFTEWPGIDDASALTGGDYTMCALRANGAVACWGENSLGQFGDGSLLSSPMPQPGPEGPYTRIVAGDAHVCGLRDGTIDCWGNNVAGQLGDGGTTTRPFAMPVLAITDAIDLVATSSATCALHANGTVSCWGGSSLGELGDGTDVPRPTPGPVPLDDVVELSGQTSRHVCARRRDDSVWCWGDNVSGQLGTGSVGGFSLVPARVPSL